jgi:putative oxidoreductase
MNHTPARSAGAPQHSSFPRNSPTSCMAVLPLLLWCVPTGGALDALNRLQPLALLVLRLVLGAIMIAHGYHKVFGGFHHHVEMVASLGLPPWLAYLSAGVEFFGGIALVLGLVTRCASIAIVIEMAVVIWKVHLRNGLTGPSGFEFPLACAAIGFALLCFGGGTWSVGLVRSGGSRGGGKTKKA